MKEYACLHESQRRLQFTENTDLTGIPAEIAAIMRRFTEKENPEFPQMKAILLVTPIPEMAKTCVTECAGVPFKDKSEGFVCIAEVDTVTVYAADSSSVLNGLMSLLQLLDQNSCFSYSCVWGYPQSSVRGVKLMMPAAGEIAEFENFVDMMAYFRHNTLMLEIGGAMEYKRHPEINSAWEKYASSMAEYSGKSKEVHDGLPWRKNSIHSNNGGASFLPQETVRQLIEYCARRGIRVIPEVPSASHCDYMARAHPEIAERCEDPYPDTYCPSDPRSYELLFDILDEVIEVFRPEIINIGHDEYYSINICDRCRKRLVSAADIYAEDVLKIHGYLRRKGVKTMLWCDKLLDIHTEDGANFGGALNLVYENWNVHGRLLGIVPPTWEAVGRMPEDLICLNWCWSFGAEYDEALRGFPVVFGNFRGESMNRYRERCGGNTSGGICSNWGATLPVYLQRNMIWFSMAYNDMLYWNAEYDDTDVGEFERCADRCFEKLYAYCHSPAFRRHARLIEIVHTTDKPSMYHSFVDGVFTSGEQYRSDYFLGQYRIVYEDESMEEIPVFLGENIGNDSIEWYSGAAKSESSSDNPGSRAVRVDCKLCEVAGSTLPFRLDGKVFYRCCVQDRHPEKTIRDIRFIPWEESGSRVEIQSISVKEGERVTDEYCVSDVAACQV